jgi:ribonuclease HI/uncharacterized phage-like protein YoqJ
VYTDGACQGNPGRGGWAWAVPGGRFRSGAELHTTNQRMEIHAALDAVRSLEGPLDVVSDSAYVVNCFRDRWWEGWLKRGWVNSAKKPVANRDLWQPLIEEYLVDPNRIRFRWVKGHSNDRMNDLVDRLAVEAATKQVGREGVGTPEDLGPADMPTAHRDAEVPGGYLMAVTGLKPPQLGGYADNPVTDRIRDKLAQILVAKRELHPDLTVVTGLGLGAEQLGAEAAAAIGVPYVAVLPFPGVEDVWPAAARQRFAKLLASATATMTLQRNKPNSRQAVGGALARRDAWIARHVAEAIVVWDGEDPTIGRTLRSLQDHLGEDEVWVLEP